MRFALLGHPVAHSLSPIIHGAAFEALALPHTYELVDAPTEEALGLAMESIRRGELSGANVTVPHKLAALGLADEAAASALAVGAANVIQRAEGGRLVAHNTDADALVAELEAALGDRPRGRAAVFGAGGAGLAAALAARRLGFGEVFVTTRSWSSAAAMAASPHAAPMRSLGARLVPCPGESGMGSGAGEEWISSVAEADLIVQASSLGMSRSGMDAKDATDFARAVIPFARLKASALVYDVVYAPRLTPFLREARAAGLTAVGGIGMLVRQAGLSFTLWTGVPAPLDVMRAACDRLSH